MEGCCKRCAIELHDDEANQHRPVERLDFFNAEKKKSLNVVVGTST